MTTKIFFLLQNSDCDTSTDIKWILRIDYKIII